MLCCLKYKASFLVATQIVNLSKKNTHAQIQLKQKLVLQLKVNHELNSMFVSLQKSDLGWCNPAYPTLGTFWCCVVQGIELRGYLVKQRAF